MKESMTTAPSIGRRLLQAINLTLTSAKARPGFAVNVTKRLSSDGHWTSFLDRTRSDCNRLITTVIMNPVFF